MIKNSYNKLLFDLFNLITLGNLMNALFEKLAQNLTPYILLLTRVVAGYMFLLYGTSKFFEVPVSMTKGNGSVELFSAMGVGGIIEIVGGALIILGLFTRPTAFLLAGLSAVAYFGWHAPEGLFNPIGNRGAPAALFCMTFLLLWLNGAGKLSLDAKLLK